MNLYVGNLAPEVREEDLRSAFDEYGEVVAVKVVKTEPSGPSRGFGFVRFSKREDALEAVAGLSGVELKGRALVVNSARKSRDRRRVERRRSRGRGRKSKGKDRRRGNRRNDERRKGSIRVGLTRADEDHYS